VGFELDDDRGVDDDVLLGDVGDDFVVDDELVAAVVERLPELEPASRRIGAWRRSLRTFSAPAGPPILLLPHA
jgi:hypothetical protein